MSRRYSGEYPRRRSRRGGRGEGGGRRGGRLVSNPLILVGIGLFVVGLLGTVVHIASIPISSELGTWSLICSNILLIIGAFSREM
ncbi:MAG TPA: hypothetical protein VKY74_14995 [Chloroflexia bacterium]|nr:hypothetical protein [Chloroflexia bacterium]